MSNLIELKKSDVETREITLTENNPLGAAPNAMLPVDLSNASAIQFVVVTSNGTPVLTLDLTGGVTVTSAAGGKIRVSFTAEQTATAIESLWYVVVTRPTTGPRTFPLRGAGQLKISERHK